MKTSLAFRFTEEVNDSRQSLVIFCSSEINHDQIIKHIKDQAEILPIHNCVYVIGLSSFQPDLRKLLASNSFVREFESLVNTDLGKLKGISVDGYGEFTCLDSNTTCAPEIKNAILLAGGLQIFKERKGVITSSSSYHFLKPSGDHCDKFIRTSNLLISSTEVVFIALSLLPFFKPNISRIYIDTSSIAFLISTAIRLSANCIDKNISIASFESYAVFKNSYDFTEDDHSLIIISATTSGSLAKDMISNRGFGSHQYVTLFHINLPKNQNGLFDVSAALDGGIFSVKAKDCDLCKRGARLIRISGDQFLPETPKHEKLVINKSHFKDREPFFREFATKNILCWNRAPSSTSEYNELFSINVKNVVESKLESFDGTLKNYKNKYISKHVNAFIHLGDEGSKELASYLADEVAIYSLDDLVEDLTKSFDSVVVVAGAITSGRKLLAASRKLRDLHDASTITYFIGFSKLPTKDAMDQLKKDLEQGGHQLIVVRNCPMPRVKKYTLTAWDFERSYWRNFSQDNPMSDVCISLPELFSSRAEELDKGNLNENGLFLTDPQGHILTLRPTFAFWSGLGLDTTQASQSDVFWTVQAVLHDLRVKSQENGLATTYHTTLISPACFDRYNDGIVQACLLRAASPVELDYAIDENFSRQMTDIILSALKNWDNSQGEGVLEFLYAIASGRMRILAEHLAELAGTLQAEMPDTIQFLLKQIK